MSMMPMKKRWSGPSMMCRGFFKLGSKRRFWALKSGSSAASVSGPACSGHIWRLPPLGASPACVCIKQLACVSDKSKVESSSGTDPGTAATPAWIGLEPGFTDLKEFIYRKENGKWTVVFLITQSTFVHTFIHWWQLLTYRVPTCSSAGDYSHTFIHSWCSHQEQLGVRVRVSIINM